MIVLKNLFGIYLLFLFRNIFLFLAFCDLCWPALTAAFSSKYFLGNPWTNFFLICQECSESWKKISELMFVDGLVEIFRPCSKSQRKKIDPFASFLETKSLFDEMKLRSSADYSNVRFGTNDSEACIFYSIQKCCFSLNVMSFRF